MPMKTLKNLYKCRNILTAILILKILPGIPARGEAPDTLTVESVAGKHSLADA